MREVGAFEAKTHLAKLLVEPALPNPLPKGGEGVRSDLGSNGQRE
jgi:hypothetical protein